ncbi:MAG: aminomethyl-transferring glycine dehydrogenase subunit GcvPA [Turicibacter sp.]|nr:aminomethyl-transferring glycine dehydrogenase subunit GcvPA [Turicibacter sp.]
MYLPNTDLQVKEMLEALGLKNLDDLYAGLPEGLKIGKLDLPPSMGEQGIMNTFSDLAGKNKVYRTIFRGAGAYNHYIPAVVPEMANKERFKTGYTPYQPEVSQGILQAIFEFQSMISGLMGMSAANASIYDGASSTAEAFTMCRDNKRNKVILPTNVNPLVRQTVATYAWAADAVSAEIPHKDGLVDVDALAASIDEKTAAVVVQQPNYFGLLEDVEAIAEVVKAKKAKLIVYSYPIAAAIVKSPGECGADIAVGEGQPLGIPLSFGGPYLGFLACTDKMLRRIPGRVAGETVDDQGRRAFVLTLQAREQHIRRETATSNICSNQALCALTAACYLAAMGPVGLAEVAEQTYSKAHYLQEKLASIGHVPLYTGEFFHEFVTKTPNAHEVVKKLAENGILGGLPLDDDHILWCATEQNSVRDVDDMISVLRS